ncbi:hypothetical protein V5O48_015705 [Marasmius crinis-equi]|uniref:NADP-dependent oxidoreductase domain-containing protein n=1 Tax=Marasmius crinis-equi TaxID=585013 RepID=A0ABR3ETT7_9AGAR
MSQIPQIKLNNGVSMPGLALGTCPDPPEFTPEGLKNTKNWFLTALKAGYRHFDTAQFYLTETTVGQAIRESGIPREEIFVTSKIAPHRTSLNPGYVERGFQKTLDDLGLDYVDLYLIHMPLTTQYPGDPPPFEFPANPMVMFTGYKTLEEANFEGTWAEFEKIYESGKAKAIGVCNFSPKTLGALSKTWKVVPAVNQIEISPYCVQKDFVEDCQKKGIAIMAYSPTGKGKVREDPKIVSVAEKYKVSTTQIILSWHVARGITPVPKSTNAERQKQNLQIVKLSDEDVQAISALDKNERLVNKAGPDGKLYGWTYEQFGWDQPY